MKAPVLYLPSFMGPNDAQHAFSQLWASLPWLRIENVPRREYYLSRDGQPYTYGKFPRQYHSQPSHPVIDKIWQFLELWTNVSFDVCFLNGYEDGTDHLGWHSDDSPEMDDKRPIAIVSLGEPREIWFREKDTYHADVAVHPEVLKPASGSLCLMAPGMQDTHQHRIPKASFQPCGPRISLTFRGVVR